KTGKVTRGYLGVSIQDVTPDLASAMNLGQTHGALVGDVDPKGPAARAGLQSGDVIVEANGKPVSASRELRLLVSSMAPGAQISLRVLHDGQTRNMNLTLGELTAKETASNSPDAPNSAQKPSTSHLGVAVTDLTPEIARQLQLSASTKGVVIADVEDGSAAAE